MEGEDGNEAVQNVSSDEEEMKGEDGNKVENVSSEDAIEYSNKEDDTWIRAIIISKLRKHKDWYIFLF